MNDNTFLNSYSDKASVFSTVVQHLFHYPMVEGSSLASSATSIERENGKKCPDDLKLKC
jgi:hypothetical protein